MWIHNLQKILLLALSHIQAVDDAPADRSRMIELRAQGLLEIRLRLRQRLQDITEQQMIFEQPVVGLGRQPVDCRGEHALIAQQRPPHPESPATDQTER